MIGARLGLPVVPVRLSGLDQVLHQKAKMATPGPARVVFGAPVFLQGDDYALLAQQVEAVGCADWTASTAMWHTKCFGKEVRRFE